MVLTKEYRICMPLTVEEVILNMKYSFDYNENCYLMYKLLFLIAPYPLEILLHFNALWRLEISSCVQILHPVSNWAVVYDCKA